MPGEQIEKSNLKSQAALSSERTLPDQLGIQHRRKESVWNQCGIRGTDAHVPGLRRRNVTHLKLFDGAPQVPHVKGTVRVNSGIPVVGRVNLCRHAL